MRQKSQSPKPVPAKQGHTPDRFIDRNLMPVSPAKTQFEPTPESPVRQHFKMAGGCD